MVEIALKDENLFPNDKADESCTIPAHISLSEELCDEESSCKEDINEAELDLPWVINEAKEDTFSLNEENSCSEDVGKVLFSRTENSSFDDKSASKESDNEVPKEISSFNEASSSPKEETKEPTKKRRPPASRDARQSIDPKLLASYDGYGLTEEEKIQKALAYMKTQRWQALAGDTLRSIKSAESAYNYEIIGRHIFFKESFLHEKEFKHEYRKAPLVTPLCTSTADLDSDKEASRREIRNFLRQLKAFINDNYKHLNQHKPETAGWFERFRIMLPHDFPSDKYKDFLKGFIELTPYEDGMAFFATIVVIGNSRFLNLYINNRHYYKKLTERPFYTAKKDIYYCTKTGRACKKDDPDAAVKYHKGDVIRTIKTHFGSRSDFVMSKVRFIEMHDQITEYMNNYFDECGCTVDDTVFLGRYIGDYLAKYTPCVRHRNAIYNSIFREKEQELNKIADIVMSSGNEHLRREFIKLVYDIRDFICGNMIYVAFPGYPGHKFGKVTVAYAGNYKVYKINIKMMKAHLRNMIERFLENFSFGSYKDEIRISA